MRQASGEGLLVLGQRAGGVMRRDTSKCCFSQTQPQIALAIVTSGSYIANVWTGAFTVGSNGCPYVPAEKGNKARGERIELVFCPEQRLS